MVEPSTHYMRLALLSVEVSREWLTDDGEYEDTDGGWQELQTQLERECTGWTETRSRWEVIFVEWQGPPDEEVK